MITYYKRSVFLNILKSRSQSYRRTFNPDSADDMEVLADLYKFCKGGENTFHIDSNIAAFQQGKRDVWLRIERYLNLTPEQLLAISTSSREEKENA